MRTAVLSWHAVFSTAIIMMYRLSFMMSSMPTHGFHQKALVRYTSTDSMELPAAGGTTESWVARTPENEKWRQMGAPANKQILERLMGGGAMQFRNYILVLHSAIPIDWLLAALELNQVRQIRKVSAPRTNPRLVHPLASVRLASSVLRHSRVHVSPVVWQAGSSAPRFWVLVVDSSACALETAKEYLRNAVFNRWENGSWTIKDYPNKGVEQVDTTEHKVPKPSFKVCAIKDGKLIIPQTTIEAYACGNLTTLARLSMVAKEHEQCMHVPAMTIGGLASEPAKKKPKVEDPAPTPAPAFDLVEVASPAYAMHAWRPVIV